MEMFFQRIPPSVPVIINPYRVQNTTRAEALAVPPPSTPPPPISPVYPVVFDLFTSLLENPPASPLSPVPSPSTPPAPPIPLSPTIYTPSEPDPPSLRAQDPTSPVDSAFPPFSPSPTVTRSSPFEALNLPSTSPSSPSQFDIPDDVSTASLQPRTLFSESLPVPDNDPAASESSRDDIVARWKQMFNYQHDYRLSYDQPTRNQASLSTLNLRNNLPWGDVLSLEKSPNTVRLYTQNINGMKLDSTGGELTTICATLQELQCDIVGFSELKLDVSQYAVKKIISSTLRSHFSATKYSASTSSIPFATFYKPGGTFTAAFDSVTTRFNNQFEDSMGRWSTLSLNGRNGRIVHFITIYQVVAKDDSGPSSAAEQQRVLLLLDNRTLKPRPAFLFDFARYLSTLETSDSQFVIMGDFNEVVGLDASGFAKVATKFELVDIHAHYHSLEDEVPTYARGTKRLDYVFCSAPIISAVKSCGAEPFNQHIFSDHRALFVDWHEDLLFGAGNSPMVPKSQRRLQSTNLQAKTKYIEALHQYCEQKNVTKRLVRLHSHPSAKRAEQLDRDITAGMLMAESKCRNNGPDPWSLKLKEARLLVSVFQHASSMATTGLDIRPKLARLLAKYALPVDIPDDPLEIKKCLQAARQAFKEVRKQAIQHRKEFLAAKVEAATILRDPRRKDFKRIMKAEEMKALYAKLRFTRNGGAPQNGLNRLDVPTNRLEDPKTCTEWMSVDTPADITQYLLERNQKHFGQAEGTPFTVPPLNVQVDFGATTEACELILNGDFDSSELDELTSLLISHFQTMTKMDALPFTITATEMMEKYRVWPESTSTSPSGRHLGHYRALLVPAKAAKPEDPDDQPLDEKRRSLVDMHYSLLAYALKNSHSYTRWHKVVNVMLEKDPGNPKIHRLRVIHLYEADYNLVLGIKWRQLIHHCEDNKLLHPSLYGARPGRGAHDPVFIEELIAEITRFSRKPTIKNAEDATACYDRIIPGAGNLASRCHGLHRNIAIIQGKTLEEVKYHLKTQLGVSEEHYQHCKLFPIYGTGQGSGNSPTIWLVLSSILFTCYSEKAFGATFESADRSIRIDIFRVGFVDDTCGYVNKFNLDVPPTPDELIALLTHDSQLWSDLLWKSGGSLELPKCTYHFWNYTFKPDGTPFLNGGRIGPLVTLTTGDGMSQQTVPYCSNYKAYKTLGCYKSPIGTQKTQWKILKDKCDLHARIVATSALSRREAWTYYFSFYLTSPGYPLPVCHFTAAELKKLETKSLPALISRSGYNRHTARRIIYGPARLNGAGFRPFETEQGVGQLQFFLKHWQFPLEPGQLLRIAVSWAQVNVGVGYSIFDDVTSSLPHFESRWLKSVRAFLKCIGGQLRLDTSFVPELQRINDSFIMDHVLVQGDFTPKEIQKINYCRLYLQALTVSDISTATGDVLAAGVEDGQVTLWSSVTKHHKTHQGKPNKASWKLWKRAMRLVSHPDGRLQVPLRQWTLPPARQRQQWPVYFDPMTDVLLVGRVGGYDSHNHADEVFEYRATGEVLILPSSAYPVTLLETERGWVVEAWTSYCPVQVPLVPTSFSIFCSQLDHWESQLLVSIELHFPPTTLISMIEASSFRACSDGSALTLQGAYGWVLSLKDGTRLAHGAGPVDGHDPQSFRAEGQGMLSVVCFLQRLRQWTARTTVLKGILATDNTGLLDRVQEQQTFKYPVPNSVFKPDWDVVEAVVQKIAESQVSVSFLHVPGHQDRDKPFEELDLMAQLNVEADGHAGDYQKASGAYRPLIPLSPTRSVVLDIDGKSIHRGVKQAIRDAAHANELLEAMQLRYDWPDGTLETIDWEAHRQSTQEHSKVRRTHYVKLCHEMLPVGSLVGTYGQSLPDYCFLCRTNEETHEHILTCHHPTRAAWRTKFLQSVSSKCDTIRTDPVLKEILLQGITSWLNGSPFDESAFPEQYRKLLDEQRVIGWKHVFQGRVSLQWSALQQSHLKGLSYIKGQDGTHWIKTILSQVFTEWNGLWDCRNSERHGKDQKEKAKSLKDQAIRELEVLYTLRNTVLHRDRTLFYDDYTQHTNEPTRVIRQWINTYKPLLLKSAKDAKTKSILHVRTLPSYYGNPG